MQKVPSWAKLSPTRKELRDALCQEHKAFSRIWTALAYAQAHPNEAADVLRPALAEARHHSERLFALSERLTIRKLGD